MIGGKVMANPIWNTLTPQYKNGDKKDGMVWFNGKWINEQPNVKPIMKPASYNNNAGVPIEPEIVDKYKDDSTFMERLTAKDSKGKSALSTIGDTLIAIGSKGWGNAGLGEGAKVFNAGMDGLTTNATQSAAKDEAMKVFNDPKSTPQQKMTAAMKAKDAGVESKEFDTMLASIGGIKQTEGNVIDPYTGKITQVLAPTDDHDYKAKDRANATGEAIKLTEAQEQIKDKYDTAKTILDADIAKGVATQAQMDSVERLKIEMENAGVKAEATAANQAATQANQATRDEAKIELNDANKRIDEARADVNTAKAALTTMDEMETYVQSQTDSHWKNAGQWMADKASIAVTSEIRDTANALSGFATKLGIDFHPGGVMTDADLRAYKEIMLNPLSSKESQLAIMAKEEAAFRTVYDNAAVRVAELEAKRDEAKRLFANAGSKQTGTTTASSTTTSGNGYFSNK